MVTHHPSLDADYLAHLQTYRSFVRGVMMAVATAAIVLLLMAAFLL